MPLCLDSSSDCSAQKKICSHNLTQILFKDLILTCRLHCCISKTRWCIKIKKLTLHVNKNNGSD